MNKNKTCCFIGHREVLHDIRANLTAQIEKLIIDGLADNFLVGNHGAFDSMVYSVLKELHKKYPHITYSAVLAYLPNKYIKEKYGDNTIYPDALEFVPKRFAILKRNEWMVKNSSFMICYVYKTVGNSIKLVDMASKKGLEVINITSNNN